MNKIKQIMTKITEGTIRVLTIAGYVALGILVALALVYIFTDLTIADKSEVDSYNKIKDQAIEQYIDSSIKK
jgi:hypothetical protein